MDMFLVLGTVEFLRKGHATVVRAFERLQIVMNIHVLLELSSFVTINILVTYLTVMYFELLVKFNFIMILKFNDILDFQILPKIFLEDLREFQNNLVDDVLIWTFLVIFWRGLLLIAKSWFQFYSQSFDSIIYKFSENFLIHQIFVA